MPSTPTPILNGKGCRKALAIVEAVEVLGKDLEHKMGHPVVREWPQIQAGFLADFVSRQRVEIESIADCPAAREVFAARIAGQPSLLAPEILRILKENIEFPLHRAVQCEKELSAQCIDLVRSRITALLSEVAVASAYYRKCLSKKRAWGEWMNALSRKVSQVTLLGWIKTLFDWIANLWKP